MKKISGLLGSFLLIMMLVAGIVIYTGNRTQAAVNKSNVYDSYKDFAYEYNDNGSIILKYYTGSKSKVVIPKKIKGKQVTTLGNGLFKMNYRIKKLVIPEGIDTIEDMALYDMQNLNDISFPSTLKKFNVRSYFGFYSEASDFPDIKIRVVKGSPAYKYVVKKYGQSRNKIIASKKEKNVVWFDANTSSAKDSIEIAVSTSNKSYKNNSKLGKLPKATARGYKFIGWYTKKNGGKKITSKYKVKKNMKLYAHWKSLGKLSMVGGPVKSGSNVKWTTIKFGQEIYSDGTTGDEYKWLVLEKKGNKALLLATKDFYRECSYNNENYEIKKTTNEIVANDCTWENSYIRIMLNGIIATKDENSYYNKEAYYEEIFNEQQKNMIMLTEVNNGGIGNNTQDKLFLLSVEEWKKKSYCLEYETSYVDGYKSAILSGPEDYTWWLRTMSDSKHAYAVDENNKLKLYDTFGIKKESSSGYYGSGFRVRPAMWVDLSDETQWSLAEE